MITRPTSTFLLITRSLISIARVPTNAGATIQGVLIPMRPNPAPTLVVSVR